MDDITRAHFDARFEVAFATYKGEAFQTLFENIMAKAHPSDFIACRPWGSAGDRKNDGYLSSERTLFQVYAPNEMRAADAIAKIDADFRGALPYWAQYFGKWVFVHNANRLAPQIVDKLLELKYQHPSVELTHWGLEELRQRLRLVPLDSLESLFGFAPTTLQESAAEKLDALASSTLPFVRACDAGIFGAHDDPGAFSPSLREFQGGTVHRPVLADEIEAALLAQRFACVLGKGASGKTTVALVLAFSSTFGAERSFYFDLAETDGSTDAAEPYRTAMLAVAQRHGRDAMLIVDNIHLAEGLAHRLYLAWREEGQPLRLLLLGRFTQPGADRRGRQSPLEELKHTALVLEVMPEDLAGVLQRLVRRTQRNAAALVIPSRVLDQWLKVFGGELIAFSSAARRRLPEFTRGQYDLTEMEATDYIRDEYLENPDQKRRITSAEQENLLAIAACASWELSVPAEGLLHPPGSALAVSMRRGLVWQSTHGRFGQFTRYRLCHPGLGKLLWSAANPVRTRLDYACAVAKNLPHFGFLLSHRLERDHASRDEIRAVLASTVESTNAFELVIKHGLVALPRIFRKLTDLRILSERELEERLACCDNLTSAALATPLNDLASFLAYAKTAMPTTWQVLADALADEANHRALTAAALTTPLNNLAGFLAYAKTPMPGVWKALANALANQTNRRALTASVFAESLNNFANFLEYAKTALPEVWKALAGVLDDETNLRTFTTFALTAPLGQLSGFLAYAQTAMPKVWQAMSAALADKTNLGALTASALAAPLGRLASFLAYAETAMPKVWRALADALADETNRRALAESAMSAPLDDLASFLAYAETSMPEVWRELADALADHTNRPALAASALAATLNDLASFLAYAETSIPELWKELAEALGNTHRPALTATALASPLNDLASFLAYTKTPMPEIWQALSNALADESNRPTLIASALATPLDHLATFRTYAKTAMPEIWHALEDALADETNIRTLTAPALATRLDHLAKSLVYAKTAMPTVWQALADALADETNRPALAASAFNTSLADLVSLLTYAKTAMPNVWWALAEVLADETNRPALKASALAAPLNDLTSFLTYAEGELPVVWQALADALVDETSRLALTLSALTTEFDHLKGFITYLTGALPDLARSLNLEIAKGFKASGAKHPRLDALLTDPRLLHEADRVLTGCGCPALAEAIACQLIQAADVSIWHAPGIQLKEVSTVLRLGRGSGQPAIRHFLHEVVTEPWLTDQYHTLPAKFIAIALHVLWAWTPPYVRDHFATAFPKTRVEACMRFLHRAEIPFPAIPNLELLGASSLLKLEVCSTTRRWPAQARIDEIARHYAFGLKDRGLNSHQILFLTGLREMVHRRRDLVHFPSDIGARVLFLMGSTASLTSAHRILNAWLLEWLEHCARRGWRLIKDSAPVPEVLDSGP